jgi:cytochrome c-type biogenesis protein CcmH
MMLRLLSLTFFLIALQAWAVSPVDVYSFDSAEQQQRYKGLIAEFRCPKCLNTNIAGSDAPIAQDLRRTVHRLVVQEGYSDQEVRDFLQARYGDFVLYNPPFNSRTMLIWLVPLGLAIVGALVLFGLLRRARQQEVVDLDESQRQRVRALLEE